MKFKAGIIPAVYFAAALSFASFGNARAATFGTVVPIRGEVSDIALDAKRRVLYAANFAANRIETVSMDSQALLSSIAVTAPPSSIAISLDSRYLVVGHYALPAAPSPALTIINLESGQQQTLSLGAASVLAVAFGNGVKALVVATDGVRLLDPATATLQLLNLTDFSSLPLPVPWATFPPQIMKASAGVSGDGNVIYALVDAVVAPPSSYVIRYDVNSGALVLAGTTTSPALGPRVVSVDQTGATLVAGWALLSWNNFTQNNSALVDLAQFPYAPGVLNQGGHAFDPARNLIYAQVAGGAIQPAAGQAPGTVTASTAPLLQIFDSDNLTVRETFQLRENLAGKALLTGDTMYAISDSGITIFPIGTLAQAHRISAMQEDLLFQSDGCSQGALTQFVDIVDPSGGATAFTLTANSPGVSLSVVSGTTPAHVQVRVDPTAFQSNKGTTTVSLQIASSQAVNVPMPVRLLINTRDPDQKGTIYDVPGTIVDVLADPSRDRFYVLRQDRNQVLVFDGTSFTQTAVLRTGNTPVQMAIAQDQLLVTNDNSQIISMFNLSTLTAVRPVVVPSGLYGRSIAVSNNAILATTRAGVGVALSQVILVNPGSGLASVAPARVYTNSINVGSAVVASPTGNTIFMPMPDGTVAVYDAQAGTFVASRKDLSSLSGGYAALSDDLFIAGSQVFDSALVPIGQVDLAGGVSSGSTIVNGKGLITSAPATGISGVIERFSTDQLNSISPVRTAEAPSIAQSLTTTPLGQIGQTILPFTRTLAPLANGQFVVQLSTSGFTAIPWGFDAALQPPVISAISSAADNNLSLAPGEIVSIWGTGLSAGSAAASSAPLPKGLGGVCLYANSIAMPLEFVSPNQVNAQLPFNITAGASVIISNSGGQSAPFQLAVQPTAPAVFRNNAGIALIIRTVDGQLITDATPIHLNEILNIYMTGLGAVSPPVNAGDVSPASPLSTTNVSPAITIGGSSIFTLWSGMAPGMVGVYQVNAQVPFHHIPTGSTFPFTITAGGASTTIMLRVEE